jgi:hypothetical protein
MFVLTEKIAPIRRPQIFNDDKAEDAAREKRDEDERWISALSIERPNPETPLELRRISWWPLSARLQIQWPNLNLRPGSIVL